MGRKKPVDQKILSYISRRRKGEYISASSLAKYIREPLEHVEHYICVLTDAGLILGVREKENGEYWIKHIWKAGNKKKRKAKS